MSSAAIEPSLPRPASAEPRRGSRRRRAAFEVVDWVRGAAVVLMIETHLLRRVGQPAGKLTAAYGWTRFVGGIPSRLFLMLVGVSIALRFECQLAKEGHRPARPGPAGPAPGLEILGLAYLFRLQEYVLGHMGPVPPTTCPAHWRDLFRVDILNCIGATMLIVPRSRRRAGAEAGLPAPLAGAPRVRGARAPCSARPLSGAHPAVDLVVPGRPAADVLVPAVSLGGLAAGGRRRRPPAGSAAPRRRRQAMAFVATGLAGLA